MTTAETEPEETPDEDEILLSESARYEITVGSSFTYRGLTHWPKITLSDGPLAYIDPGTNDVLTEDGESLIYRVEETAHRRLAIVIARMKREMDKRAADDLAARSTATNPTQGD